MTIDFTPKTKRLIVGSIGLIGLAVTIGWACGVIESDKALIILPAILTGFFGLLKGVE